MASTLPRLFLIRTKEQLARAIGVPVELIIRRAFEVNQVHLYSMMTKPKRSGGIRTIHAPHWPMLNIQTKLLGLLEEIYRPSSRVMGFVKGGGIKKNATFHVGKRLILNVDLADYFGTVHFGRVRGRLMSQPYGLTDDVATTIAKLCTLDGVLPTGAPTSPILANMVTSSLDHELTQFAKTHGCFYTRYADDITFSTNRRSFPQSMVRRSDDTVSGVEIGPELNQIFVAAAFPVQPTKTRLMNRTMRQEVCGVTCNERLNVRRSLMREVRGALHAWRRHGKELAEKTWRKKYNWRHALSLERSLRGKIEHIIHIRGENDQATANLVEQFNALTDREFKNLAYAYSPKNPLGILDSVCLIETEDNDLVIYSQGSGFVIEGGAVLTNFHVVSHQLVEDGKLLPARAFPEIYVNFEKSSIRHKMKIVYSDPRKDIAILRVEDSAWGPVFERLGCRLSFTAVERGASVSIAGYPNHTTGASCRVFPGHVTGIAKHDGQTYFNVSQAIVKGNSGGPVFDDFGQVVGIATKGVDAEDVANLTFNGCIPIYTIDRIILNDS